MEYVKINGTQYPAVITGKLQDQRFGRKSTKTVKVQMTYADLVNLFVDDVSWSIISDGIELDNSEYNVAGPVTDYRDGWVEVTMIKDPVSVPQVDDEILKILFGESV